jgi:hypothetical protein
MQKSKNMVSSILFFSLIEFDVLKNIGFKYHYLPFIILAWNSLIFYFDFMYLNFIFGSIYKIESPY